MTIADVSSSCVVSRASKAEIEALNSLEESRVQRTGIRCSGFGVDVVEYSEILVDELSVDIGKGRALGRVTGPAALNQ